MNVVFLISKHNKGSICYHYLAKKGKKNYNLVPHDKFKLKYSYYVM